MTVSVEQLAHDIARTLVARPFTWPAVEMALTAACGRHDPALARLTTALTLRFARQPRPNVVHVADYLAARRRFASLFGAGELPLCELPRPTMLPLPGAPSRWRVPAIVTTAELASWLDVTGDQLAAWCRRWHPDPERRDDRLQHYHRRWLPRRRGPPRLLEAPKAKLKAAQRRILEGILAHIPAHPAAHGFVRGRSVATFTAEHTRTACVLRLDVTDFFGSIVRARVRAVFVAAGYPIDVTDALAAICTTATPHRVLSHLAPHGEAGQQLTERLQREHLPQGAPTSPTLANLVAFRLDARLTGLARRFGARYTRYADDLLFSGGNAFARASRRCAVHVAAVLLQEGFAAAHRKTRSMRQGTAQHACGLVLNVHAAVPRAARERLEAVLHNCVRRGPSTQNRNGVADFHAHLRGRVAHVAHHHEPHGRRLQELLDRIDWAR